MTKQTISTNPIATTDALFRAWGAAHSAALAAVAPTRLVQTADTGQINWVTVLKPAASTTAGYEIWKMSDAGLPDVYIKISYGMGAAAAASTCTITAVVIGTTTNGAGTLGGVTQTLAQGPPLQSASNAAINVNSPSYIAAPAGALVLVVNAAGLSSPAGAASCVLVIDRTRDATGTPTGVGLAAWLACSSTTSYVYVLHYGFNFSTPGIVAATPPVAATPDATSMSPAGSFVLSRHYARLPALYAVVGVLTYLNAEALALTEFDVVPLGSTSRHYLCLGSGNAGNAASNQSNAAVNAAATNESAACLAVLWEN